MMNSREAARTAPDGRVTPRRRIDVLGTVAVLLIGYLVAVAAPAQATASSFAATITNFDTAYHQLTKFDTAGAALDAHEGQIIQAGGLFYLYGERHNCGVEWQAPNTPWCGVSMYSSPDLVHWTNLGVAFDPMGHPGAGSTVGDTWQTYCDGNTWGCYRPRVAYNAANHNYVMWLNGYGQPNNPSDYWIFTSASPSGPWAQVQTSPTLAFNAVGVKLGDPDVFVDSDGTGYLAYQDWTTNHEVIEKLNSTYTGQADTTSHVVLSLTSTEAPAMFKRGSTYYLSVSSPNCGYCNNTGTAYVSATNPLGPWSAASTVISAPNGSIATGGSSCGGQPSAVTPISTVDSSGVAKTSYLYQSDQNTTTDQNEGPANLFWGLLAFQADGSISPLTCNPSVSVTLPGTAVSDPTVANQDANSGRSGFGSGCGTDTVAPGHALLQTFTAISSGTLSSVSVGTYERYLPGAPRDSSPNAGLTMSVVSLSSGGTPAGVLSSTTVPRISSTINSLDTDSNHVGWSPRPAGISPNITVTAGQRYGIELSTTATQGCYGVERNPTGTTYASGTISSSADAGATWSTPSAGAIQFSTQVDAVSASGSFDFGAVAVGTTSGPIWVTVTNTRSIAASFTGFGWTDRATFVLAGGTCGWNTVLAANGGSCTLAFTAHPSAPGTSSDTVVITFSNAPTLRIPLSVYGFVPSPKVFAYPSAGFGFGHVPVGDVSQPITVTVANLGAAATLTGYSWANRTTFVDFGSTCSRNTVLAANGDSCTITVVAQPLAPGTTTDTMVITFSNAPTLRIPLSVTGAPWTLVDDASSAITYSGFLTVTGIDPGLWYQGTAHSATNAGASASYTCTACTRVDWLATTGPDRGTATVSVDGKYVTTIDSFASTLTASHVLYSAAGLALGAHTITVTATGAPRSTGSWIEIDEFRSA